jgi:photosystem II stability/assembly factor-like uncharacterized protein
MNDLSEVFFVDDQHGWAVGFSTVLNTTNGGSTWNEVEMPSAGVNNAVHFADNNTGWISGAPGYNFYNTTNGGATWQIQTSGSNEVLLDIYFINNLKGWAVGGAGTVVRTTNGGQSWQSQISSTTND